MAEEVGLGRRVNMVMQSAFFALSGVMPMDKARCLAVGCRLGGPGCACVVVDGWPCWVADGQLAPCWLGLCPRSLPPTCETRPCSQPAAPTLLLPRPALPPTATEQAIPLLKESIKKAYGKKGDKARCCCCCCCC